MPSANDTSFVTLALDEDLFRRDVHDGEKETERERFSLNERCGGALNVISKCRGKLFARCRAQFGQ